MTGRYIPPMPNTWWNKNAAYRLFMLRELSSVFVALFMLELLCFAMQARQGGAEGDTEAVKQFVEALDNPLWLLFHVVVLAFALFHTITWFNLTPKVQVIRLGEDRLPDIFVSGPLYAAWIIVSAVIWWLVTRG